MRSLLILAGVAGAVYTVYRMARPGEHHRLGDRRQGWLALAASLAMLLVGGTLASDPNDSPSEPLAAVAVETTVAITDPTGSTSLTTTTTGTSSTTEVSTPTSVEADPVPAVVPGPSGDPSAPLPTGAEVVTVISITDGDTIEVGFSGGGTDTVRLIGINTPESGECFADDAAALLETLAAPGSSVAMTTDVSDRDQYGRLLRYLWVGGFSLNEEMVRRGAAIARRYPPDTALADRFDTAQDDARSAEAGLWAAQACGPAAEATLSIVAIEYDAPGNDNENLNEEWVVVRNDGNSAVALSGWVLRDETASHRYLFPSDLVLAPGETVTIRSGCGQDFGTTLHWCNTGSAIWNNDGDTGFLLDSSGNIHDTYEY